MEQKKTLITPDISLEGYFRGMWEARRVLYFLVGREALSRYRQTTFGLLWAAFQPLSMMLVLTLVFRNYIPSDGGQLPYSLFVLTGLVGWQLFSRTIEMGSTAMIMHKGLITKIYIPRIFIPLSHGLVGFIDAACGALILLLLMLAWGIAPPPQAVLLPLLLFYCFYCAAGITLILSVLNVHYRDVQFAVSFLMRLGFFITPVSYPASVISRTWEPVYYLNPMAGALEALRWSVAGGPVNMPGLALSFIVSTALFLAALKLFQRMEYRIADVI